MTRARRSECRYPSSQCLGTGESHRLDQQVDLFVGETEELLTQDDALVRHVRVRTVRQVVHVDQTFVDPLLVRVLGSEFVLQFLVADDPALRSVHEEHATGLEADLADHGGRIDRQDADLRRHDDEAVFGDPQTRRTQTVAVQHGADDGAVGEAHRRRSVPRLHESRVVLVERDERGPCSRASPRLPGSS